MNYPLYIRFIDPQGKTVMRAWDHVPRVGDEIMLSMNQRYTPIKDRTRFSISRVLWCTDSQKVPELCVDVFISPIQSDLVRRSAEEPEEVERNEDALYRRACKAEDRVEQLELAIQALHKNMGHALKKAAQDERDRLLDSTRNGDVRSFLRMSGALSLEERARRAALTGDAHEAGE